VFRHADLRLAALSILWLQLPTAIGRDPLRLKREHRGVHLSLWLVTTRTTRILSYGLWCIMHRLLSCFETLSALFTLAAISLAGHLRVVQQFVQLGNTLN
jgi:hypothetical protein